MCLSFECLETLLISSLNNVISNDIKIIYFGQMTVHYAIASQSWFILLAFDPCRHFNQDKIHVFIVCLKESQSIFVTFKSNQ